MSSSLTSADKKYLRGRAQVLRAAVHIGKGGLSEAIYSEIDLALTKHQLVKIQFHMDKPAMLEAIEAIEKTTGSESVGQIGRTASFYRAAPAQSADDDDGDEQ